MKLLKLSGLFTIVTLAITSPIDASEVSIPHQFEAKTTAKAADVNANFDVLKEGVNDNNNRITALESSSGDSANTITNLQGRMTQNESAVGRLTASNTCSVGQVVTGIGTDGKVVCEDNSTGSRLGMFRHTAAASCKAILDAGDSFGSGSYFIDPNGGDNADAFKVYCDMDTNGGGWTLCGKFDRDNAVSKTALESPFARAQVNVGDLKSISQFTDFQASQDCRTLIANGATQILSAGTDRDSNWGRGRIIDIIAEVKANPGNLWNIEADEDGTGICGVNAIITYRRNGENLGISDGGGDLGDRAVVTGDGAFWTNFGRTGATFSNASTSSCTATRDDTVYWSWVDSDGALDDHGCNLTQVLGTGCGQATTWTKPSFRYNLMFMR